MTVPESAWAADAEARARGRVQMFNAGRPGGLDGWTMDLRRYELLRALILELVEDADGPVLLKEVERVPGSSPQRIRAAGPGRGTSSPGGRSAGPP